jgi:hypothetical protein
MPLPPPAEVRGDACLASLSRRPRTPATPSFMVENTLKKIMYEGSFSIRKLQKI